MGHVYRARHNTMNRDVALKVLTPKLMNSPDAVSRFHREIKAAAQLHHPNIVTAFDAGEQDGLHFLVMEFVDGRNLSSYVRSNGPLNLKQAIKCVIQAAKGLGYAHEQNIVHRDIKPSNLLVDRKGTVKVLDMGLARFEIESEGEGLTDLTGSGVVMGTIDYMAPEQSLDTRIADARSDVYSLGCTMYFLLTGRTIYSGDTVMKKLLAHREAEIPRLRTSLPKIPESVEQIFQTMVAKDREDRFQSMPEMISALQTCLQVRKPSYANSEPSTIADPQLASFVKSLEEGTFEADSGEATDSPSDAAAYQETVIGDTLPLPKPLRQSNRRRKSNRKTPIAIASGLIGLILLLGVIITITGRDGKKTVVDVPDGSQVKIDEAGSVDVKLAQKPATAFADSFENAMTLEFSGPHDHVLFPTFPAKMKGPFTVDVWFLPQKASGKRMLLQLSGLAIYYREDNGWGPWMSVSEEESVYQQQLTPLPENKPVHVAFVVDTNRLDFYLNGLSQGDKGYLNLKDPSRSGVNLPANFEIHNRFSGRFVIGSENNDSALMIPGKMLECRVSNTARHNGDFTPEKRYTPDEHTVALYHFDKGSGPALKDYSGNGYHGVIKGAKWARLGQKPAPPTSPPKVSTPLSNDREVAEWVIQQGGNVTLQGQDLSGGYVNIKRLEELPQRPFQIVYIDLFNIRTFTDDAFERFPILPALASVYVQGTNASSNFIEWISRCPLIQAVHVTSAAGIMTSDLSRLDNPKWLHKVVINYRQINDDWRVMEKLPHLKTLVIWGESLPALPDNTDRFASLQYIKFASVKSIPTSYLQTLKKANPKLRIGIGHPATLAADDPILPSISNMEKNGAEISGQTEDGKECTMTTLKSGGVYAVRSVTFPHGTIFHDDLVDQLLLICEGLYFLNADHSQNTDHLIAKMEEAKLAVVNLQLVGSDLSDEGLNTLKNWKFLKVLNVHGTQVTEAGFQKFREHVPNCHLTTSFGTFEPKF